VDYLNIRNEDYQYENWLPIVVG